jgi:hypothetical protein
LGRKALRGGKARWVAGLVWAGSRGKRIGKEREKEKNEWAASRFGPTGSLGFEKSASFPISNVFRIQKKSKRI